MYFGRLTTFQMIVLAVFGVAIIGGVAAFALYTGTPSGPTASLTLWGPYERPMIDNVLKETVGSQYDNINVTYQQVPEAQFDQRLVEALAVGEGPDLVFLPEDRILKHQDKLIRLSFETYPEEEFQNSFVEAGEIFVLPDGIIGLPVTIDPLVMYWNRDLHNQETITAPPETWSQLNTDRYQRLIHRDGQTINQALVPFGGYENVRNAKYILATLMMQAGTPIVERERIDRVNSALASNNQSAVPAVSAVSFYTQFADPGSRAYSWNNSLPESRQAFANTDLALYFGFASERRRLLEMNPNFNFGTARLPQRSGAPRLTTARLEAIAITRQSQNPQAALLVAQQLSGPEGVGLLAERLGLPPVRRDLLSEQPGEAHRQVFFDSVFWARSWLDPDPVKSEQIFAEMISSIRSGRYLPSGAVSRAHELLNNALAGR